MPTPHKPVIIKPLEKKNKKSISNNRKDKAFVTKGKKREGRKDLNFLDKEVEKIENSIKQKHLDYLQDLVLPPEYGNLPPLLTDGNNTYNTNYKDLYEEKNLLHLGQPRDLDGDTRGENILEFIDPTGISSWDDVYRAYKKGDREGTIVEGLGAIPLIGKAMKIAKAAVGSQKALKAVLPLIGVKSKDIVEDVINIQESDEVEKFETGGIVNGINPYLDTVMDSLVHSKIQNANTIEKSSKKEKLPVKEEILEEETEVNPNSSFEEMVNNMFNEEENSSTGTQSNYGGDIGDAVNHIVGKESGGNYSAESPNSTAVGKYQFLWGKGAGKGHQDKIKKVTGVRSKEEFKNNPSAQEEYFAHYMKTEVLPNVPKYKKMLSKVVPGITDAQVIAAYHFAGPKNIEKAVKSGDINTPLDANGTSIASYIAPSKNKKMSKKKYENGGQIKLEDILGMSTNLGSQALQIAEAFSNLNSYSPQPVVTAKQTAQYNPYSNNFGNTNLPSFAFGGQAPIDTIGQALLAQNQNVPIEAEGQEVIETPKGQVAEIEGPSHSEGGVPMNVPVGSEIYSKRISIDNKTMAERKKIREKRRDKLEKLLEEEPQNVLLKNTHRRTMQALDREDAMDMQIQETARAASEGANMQSQMEVMAQNPMEDLPQFYSGGGVRLKPELSLPLTSLDPSDYGDMKMWNPNKPKLSLPPMDLTPDRMVPKTYRLPDRINPISTGPYLENTSQIPQIEPVSMSPMNTVGRKEPVENYNSIGDPTLGDYIGFASTGFNAFAPLLSTIGQRRGDMPNINSYQNFGKDALDTIEQSQQYVANNRENALGELRQQLNATRAGIRNNATSLNTMRAMDTAITTGYGQGVNKVYGTTGDLMTKLLAQKAELQNKRDAEFMKGEATRIENDTKDRDAYNQNILQSLLNMGENFKGIGKNINKMQGNQDFLSLLPLLTQNEISFYRDENGNLQIKTPE